jgi:DNA invertase Pin-like site-specific DNA recombinase
VKAKADRRRVAFYARISTKEGRQFTENQLAQMREYAERMDLRPCFQAIDEESGERNQRPGLDSIMEKAGQGVFDVLLVWDLSRLTRGGPAQAFTFIGKLKAFKVEFWSFTEPHFRTDGPAGELFIAIAAYIAQAENKNRKERIKAGMQRARASGKHIGRRRRVLNRDQILLDHSTGLTFREIAKKHKTSPPTVFRIVEEHRNKRSPAV